MVAFDWSTVRILAMASYHSWLQQVVVPYFDPGRVFRDVDVTLQTFSTLRPKTDNFMRSGPTGVQLLICLFGVMPCGLHNIPIELWLPRAYPRESPMVFVVPSQGIPIRPTRLVDPTGRVIGLGWHPEGGAVALLRALGSSLAVDPPFYPGSGRPVYTSGGGMSACPPPPTAACSFSPFAPPVGRPPMTGMGSPFPPPPVPPQYGAAPPPGNVPDSHSSLVELRRVVKDKLRRRYKELQMQMAIETDHLLSENTRLSEGEAKLDEGIRLLNEEIAKVGQEIEQTRKSTEMLIEMADKAAADGGEVDYENLVVPQGPIAQQLMDLVGEDLAIQDTIYAFSKIFHEGKADITLATYLKQLRELAREQFMAKALYAKIRRKFPLINK